MDLELTLPRSLTELADARVVVMPAFSTIVERAAGARVRASKRPRRVAAAAVAGGLTLGIGGAALAGVLPGPVSSAFHRMSGWGGPCRIDRSDAHLVASTRTPSGDTLEWWQSSTATSDHVDDFDRRIAPGGDSHDNAMSCHPRFDGRAHIAIAMGETSATEVDVFGQAPIGTATLTVTMADGTAVPVPLQRGRFFIGAFATARSRPVTATATAADGSVIDQQRVDFPSR
jgi:hypothetical protein